MSVLRWVPDYENDYKASKLSATMNMFEFGMYKLECIFKQRKRGLIGKSECNFLEKEIKKQLLKLDPK